MKKTKVTRIRSYKPEDIWKVVTHEGHHCRISRCQDIQEEKELQTDIEIIQGSNLGGLVTTFRNSDSFSFACHSDETLVTVKLVIA